MGWVVQLRKFWAPDVYIGGGGYAVGVNLIYWKYGKGSAHHHSNGRDHRRAFYFLGEKLNRSTGLSIA